MRYSPILLLLLLFCESATAQEPLLANAYHRASTSLNGYWKYIIDPYENGYYNYRYEAFDQQEQPWKSAFFLNSKQDHPSELLEYNFDGMDSLLVPGDWNTQKPELLYYEGTVWYKKSFDYTPAEASKRVFLYFEAANYKAEVYLNGTKLGTHIGGFTPFNFEVSKLLQPSGNALVVKVDNKRVKEGIPTLNTDWWNYGGLTRDVQLIEVPETYIQDYVVQLNPTNVEHISGYVQLSGSQKAAQAVTLSIPEMQVERTLQTHSSGRASFDFDAEQVNY